VTLPAGVKLSWSPATKLPMLAVICESCVLSASVMLTLAALVMLTPAAFSVYAEVNPGEHNDHCPAIKYGDNGPFRPQDRKGRSRSDRICCVS